MTVEIPEEAVDLMWGHVCEETERSDVRAGLVAVLGLPGMRQAIHDEMRRETEQKLRDMGVTGYSVGWDQ